MFTTLKQRSGNNMEIPKSFLGIKEKMAEQVQEIM